MDRKIKRGDMYYTDLMLGVGSEQSGKRPVLIIQNNIGNKYSGTVIVAIITSKTEGKHIMETKKMILSRIMQSVKVSRDYEIEIDFTVDFEQIGGQAHLGSITENCSDLPDEITQKAVSF